MRRCPADFRGKYLGAATGCTQHRGGGHRPDHRVPDGAHYGRVVRDEVGQVAAVVQAKDSQDRPDILAIREINTGAYCFDASFLRSGLTKIPKSPVTGEIYLTDLIHIAREQGRGVEALVDPDWESAPGDQQPGRAGRGHPDRQAPDQRPAHGPGGHPDGPGGHLYRVPGEHRPGHGHLSQRLSPGQTPSSARTASSRPRSRLSDSILENDVHVKMGCVITQSRLGAGVDVGPFAHLRPLSDLRSGVHVGNFVEVKKSVLHEGVKAGHLTYLGDADIGAGTNVGAGTITCNYDGVQKAPHHHRRGGLHRQQHRPGGAGDRGRRGLRWGRLHHHPGRAAGKAGHRPGPPGE